MAKIDDLNQQIKELSAQLRLDPLKFDTKDIEAASTYVKALQSNLREVNSELSYVRDAFADSVNELSKGNNYLNESKKALRGISSISQKLVSIKEGETKATTDQIKKLQVQAKLKFQLLQTSLKMGDLQPNEKLEIKKSILAQKEFIVGAQKVLNIQTEINKNAGVKLFGGLEDITKAIPGLSKFTGAFTEASEAAESQARFNKLQFGAVEGITKAQKAQRVLDLKALRSGKALTKEAQVRLGLEAKYFTKAGVLNKTFKASTIAKAVKPLGKSMTPFMAGLKSIAPALSKALGPISFIIEAVRAIGSADKQLVEIQKSMALSSDDAVKFRSELIGAAARTNDINITATALNKTFGSISKQFGFIAKFSSDTLITTTKLTDVVGIGAEAANNLAAASVSSGVEFESAYKNAIGTSYELQRQEGVQFDLRQILEESGKITGTIRANLGANITVIAEAVTEAKLFGSTLNEVAAAGKQLLDFESSITNELKAELLIGRNINLEKARLAALNGDQVTLAKELRREAGDFTEFSNMNVIQQEAIAAAVGMQSDQLADILFKQDIQGKTAEQLRAQGKDELADMLEKQTMQEKFNASIVKLQELFTDVFTAVSPILTAIVGIVELVGFIVSPFGRIIEFLNKMHPLLGGVASLLVVAGTAAMIMATSLTFGGALAILAGVGGVLAGIFAAADAITVGDMFSPADGKTQVSTKEGGLFELSSNDDLIAAPGAANAMNSNSNNPSPDLNLLAERKLEREEKRRERRETRDHQRRMEQKQDELISEARETNRGYLYSA